MRQREREWETSFGTTIISLETSVDFPLIIHIKSCQFHLEKSLRKCLFFLYFTVDALVPASIACWDYGKNLMSCLSPSKILLPQSIPNIDANHMTSFSHLWSNRSSWSGSTCLISLQHLSSSRPHTPATADLALTFVKVVPSAFSFVFGNVLLGPQNLVQKYFSDAFTSPSGSVSLLQSSYFPHYTLSS